jgi:hypothetical protein
VLFVLAVVAFVFFGNMSVLLHARFLRRLKSDFPDAFENAGRPSQFNSLLPPGLGNRRYARWLKTLHEGSLPSSMRRLYRWSQVSWALALGAWAVGILLV